MVSLRFIASPGAPHDNLQPKEIRDIKQFIEIARRKDASGGWMLLERFIREDESADNYHFPQLLG